MFRKNLLTGVMSKVSIVSVLVHGQEYKVCEQALCISVRSIKRKLCLLPSKSEGINVGFTL